MEFDARPFEIGRDIFAVDCAGTGSHIHNARPPALLTAVDPPPVAGDGPTAAVTFDQQLWAKLTSLRFLADAYNVLIMGTRRRRKNIPGQRLRAHRRTASPQRAPERADKLFKRLRGARLDNSYEDEMRKLDRVELLIIDDLA